MEVTVLASGSGGNATLFESRGTRVLVDGGLGPRALARELSAIGVELPHAIVITHAHHDHVANAPRLGKKLRVPIYMTDATARRAPMPSTVDVVRFHPRAAFGIGALTIAPTPLPHDAAQVALSISDGACTALLATDLGEVTGALLDVARACDVLLLESNHDVTMLESGPYPSHLKQRIRGARGHLSNDQAHALLRRLSHRTRTVVLMHLSQTNNSPRLALESARDALSGRAISLSVASPRQTMRIESHVVPRRGEQLAMAFGRN